MRWNFIFPLPSYTRRINDDNYRNWSKFYVSYVRILSWQNKSTEQSFRERTETVPSQFPCTFHHCHHSSVDLLEIFGRCTLLLPCLPKTEWVPIEWSVTMTSLVLGLVGLGLDRWVTTWSVLLYNKVETFDFLLSIKFVKNHKILKIVNYGLTLTHTVLTFSQ